MISYYGKHYNGIQSLYDMTILPVKINFKKLTDTAIPFKYSREGDACMDMYADMDAVLYPHDRKPEHAADGHGRLGELVHDQKKHARV